MASNYSRDEIREAVREEVTRILRSPSTGTEQENSEIGNRSTTTRPSANTSSDRTLSFEEFYRNREQDRQNGFQPKKKIKTGNSSTAIVSKKAINVEIKVGLAASRDGVIKLRLREDAAHYSQLFCEQRRDQRKGRT